MKKILFFLFFINFVIPSHSQFLYDTTFIKKRYDRTILGFYENLYVYSLELKQFKNPNENSTINYKSESRTSIGVSFSRGIIAASISLLNILPDSAAKKGEMKSINYSISLTDKNYFFETAFHWNKGFYDQNSSSYIIGAGQTAPYFQNHSLRIYNANIDYWIFNNYKKFSYNVAYSGMAKQKRSAATTIWYSSLQYNNLKTDSSVVPPAHTPSYDFYNNWHRSWSASIYAGLGGSATLVIFKNFFLNGLFVIAPGYQWRQLTDDSGRNNQSLFIIAGSVRGSLGFTNNHIRVAVVTKLNYINAQNSIFSMSNQISNVDITINYMFEKKK